MISTIENPYLLVRDVNLNTTKIFYNNITHITIDPTDQKFIINYSEGCIKKTLDLDCLNWEEVYGIVVQSYNNKKSILIIEEHYTIQDLRYVVITKVFPINKKFQDILYKCLKV